MSIESRLIDYDHEGGDFEGLLVWDGSSAGPRPGVMVAHAWGGRSEFEDNKAVALAKLGYTSFAMDLYGKGVRGGTKVANAALMQPFIDDRQLLQDRMLVSLDTLREQPETIASAVAAIGFCFGGMCVLDLARTGEDLAGVVSFHGLLGAPGNTADTRIRARVLVLHGWDDPMAPPDDVMALGRELSEQEADWQILGFGQTVHAFTNPNANDPEFGTVYSPGADRRSWVAMQHFLAEIFDG